MTDAPSYGLAALVICPSQEKSTLPETLLSLAAETRSDFEVVIVADEGSDPEVDAVVHTFDAEFSDRVRVVVQDAPATDTPLAFGVARSRADYVALFDPGDVVFAHWADSFTAHTADAAGRAMSSLVATQRVEPALWADAPIVTTTARPRVLRDGGFDLLRHLVAPPTSLRGMALPRQAVQEILGHDVAAPAQEWAVLLGVALRCGVFETGEVTMLHRPPVADNQTLFDPAQWARHRQAALEAVERDGLTVAAGTLESLQRSLLSEGSSRPDEELTAVRAQLRQAQEAARLEAATAAAARQRVEALLSSRSWMLSAPIRRLGEGVRRVRSRLRDGPAS